jgi:hypothetical protein
MSVASALRATLGWIRRLLRGKGDRFAGHQLGFDPTRVPIENGVALIQIGYLLALRPADIRRVKEALRARGAVSALALSGPVEREELAALLGRLQAAGRPYFGGRIRFLGVQGVYPYYEITFDSLE